MSAVTDCPVISVECATMEQGVFCVMSRGPGRRLVGRASTSAPLPGKLGLDPERQFSLRKYPRALGESSSLPARSRPTRSNNRVRWAVSPWGSSFAGRTSPKDSREACRRQVFRVCSCASVVVTDTNATFRPLGVLQFQGPNCFWRYIADSLADRPSALLE